MFQHKLNNIVRSVAAHVVRQSKQESCTMSSGNRWEGHQHRKLKQLETVVIQGSYVKNCWNHRSFSLYLYFLCIVLTTCTSMIIFFVVVARSSMSGSSSKSSNIDFGLSGFISRPACVVWDRQNPQLSKLQALLCTPLNALQSTPVSQHKDRFSGKGQIEHRFGRACADGVPDWPCERSAQATADVSRNCPRRFGDLL